MEPTVRPATSSFTGFILKDKTNCRYLWIAVVGTILQFIVFKLLYPFPDFFSDSYSYLSAAYEKLDVAIWPIGYSKFLYAFHELTTSDTALVGFQYFFLELSALYFFFTILHFFQPSKINRVILFLFLFFNPLSLYLSNYVNSDPLFAALSLLWFSQLLWIIYQPKLYQVFVQAILLFFCFTVRNNAYYYPLIAILAFLLSRQSWKLKLLGMGLPFVFILPFIVHTRNAAFEMTGTKQFSLFTGWQLANNALYFYDKIQVDSSKLPSAAAKDLDQLSKRFFKNLDTRDDEYREYLSTYVGNFFIRDSRAPLKQYFGKYFEYKDQYGSIVAWGKASAVFDEYGTYLLKHYPLAFARYFVPLNVKNYFLPPLEKLEIYNLGEDDVELIAQDWFNYKTSSVIAISKTAQGEILFIFPYIFLLVNLLFVGSLVWWLIKKEFLKRQNAQFNKAILLTASLFLANFFFCILATIIVFRYEFFPMITTLSFSLLLIEFMDKREALTEGRQFKNDFRKHQEANA